MSYDAKKILFTGFAPFGGESVNPSYEAVRHLPKTVNGMTVVKAELPVSYTEAPKKLEKLIKEHRPVSIICFGQAGKSTGVRVEHVAVNSQDAASPDNDGLVKSGSKINDNGQDEEYSTLPIFYLLESLKEAGIPAEQSESAGRYVCNTVFYRAMELSRDYDIRRAGFIHVPYAETQVLSKDDGTPCLPQSEIDRAVAIIADKMT